MMIGNHHSFLAFYNVFKNFCVRLQHSGHIRRPVKFGTAFFSDSTKSCVCSGVHMKKGMTFSEQTVTTGDEVLRDSGGRKMYV